MKTMKHLAPLALAILLCSATSADEEVDGYYPGDPINPDPGVPIDNPHPPNSPPTKIPFDPDVCADGVGLVAASLIPGANYGKRFIANWVSKTVGKRLCTAYGPNG
ncbi:MAG: hypothetical protein OXH15_08225 [Gammaproteobacteria bacterium]|nr:hypothetical protein [Gammaproteobacteria bacterium]